MDSIVALDIETTGLNPDKDSIIEIGLVRFTNRRVDHEWASLVNPGKPIPPFITQLTGITDQKVREAPPLRDVLTEVRDFVGDSPILGHSVRFDLSFLRKYGLFGLNDSLDTYELASVLLPCVERYNLAALAQALSVPLPASHRALDDARVTRVVYLRLLDQALEMPIHLLAELIRLGEGVEWGGFAPLQQVLRQRSR